MVQSRFSLISMCAVQASCSLEIATVCKTLFKRITSADKNPSVCFWYSSYKKNRGTDVFSRSERLLSITCTRTETLVRMVIFYWLTFIGWPCQLVRQYWSTSQHRRQQCCCVSHYTALKSQLMPHEEWIVNGVVSLLQMWQFSHLHYRK